MEASFVGVYTLALDDIVQHHGLTFAEKGVLTSLVFMADHKTGGRTGWTIREVAERVGLHEANLRPKLKRLAERGLIEYRFPRGHEGMFLVRCYLDLAHVSERQRAKHPLRNARSLRSDQGLRDQRSGAVTRGSRGRNARSTRSDQDPPVCKSSDPTRPRKRTPDRDPVSIPAGLDVSESPNEPFDTPVEVADARRALTEAANAQRLGHHPLDRRPSSRAADVSDHAADDEEDEEKNITSSPSLGSTPQASVVELAAHIEARSRGSRERDQRATVDEGIA